MLFIILITTILAFLLVHQFKKSSRLPPGPVGIPLIGNIHQIVYYSWKNGGVVPMLNMYRKKYGNVYTLWCGPVPYVNICDYETAHEVFVKHGNKYADRFSPPLFHHIQEGRGVFTSNGELWQELRRFSLTVFRNMGVGKDLMEKRILAELDARCAEIDEKAVNGVTVEQANSFFEVTIGSIINSMLLGSRFDEETLADFKKMRAVLEKANMSLSAADLVLPVWFLKSLFPKQFEFQVNAQFEAREYVSRAALERIEKFRDGKWSIDPENPQDLVDSFILKMQSEPENPAYSVASMKELLIDLWVTGQDTTALSISSAFNHFVNNPQVMDKIRDELMKVTNNGSRPLSLKDKHSTPYLNATIAEIQRHASILNVNFWRINHELTTVGGYPVDSGALITAQLSVLHTNDETFKNSNEFNPSRFIENDKLAQQIIPFGIGKRSCLGESLARAEMYLIIGNLLLRYKFRAHGPLPSVDDLTPFGFKFGNVYTLWIGPFPHVNICNYETAHEVFVKHGNKYVDKWNAPFFEYAKEGRGVFAANGKNWQELRRFSLMVFRNMGVGKNVMEERILEELNARCAEIDEKAVNGVTVEQSNTFFDLTIGSIINSMLVGSRFDQHTQAEFEKIKELVDETMQNMSILLLTLPIWVLRAVFSKRLNRQVDNFCKTKEYVSRSAIERLKEHQAGKWKIDPENPQDLVDAFILKMQSEPENPAYSEDSLKELLFDLWVTGQETTTTTLTTAFNNFLHKPEVMENIRNEVMKVTNNGSRLLSQMDRNDTPYLNATIAEVQRHASIVNVNFWKINHEVSNIGGYTVDSGARITAQLSVNHTNNDTFHNSKDFDPSRFIDNDKLAQQLIPFGIGKRSCLGESLARAELYLVIGNLLLRYKFRPHGELPILGDTTAFGFGKRPSNVMMEFIKI